MASEASRKRERLRQVAALQLRHLPTRITADRHSLPTTKIRQSCAVEPSAADRYEVRWSHRNENEGLIDGIVHAVDALLSGWGGPGVPGSTAVAICEKGGREVARMTVSVEAAQAMYDRVQADLETLSAADFEREWGITPAGGKGA
jgi:hypothetical protein